MLSDMQGNERGSDVTISPVIPGRWIHSFEEDDGDVHVYRKFFDFPPGPRGAFETLRDGTFILEEVGSSGATVEVTGRWRQPADDRLTVSFADGVHAGFTLQAIELSENLDMLRARRLPEPTQPPATSPNAAGETYT